jgi:CheY-like chemotaxis protein
LLSPTEAPLDLTIQKRRLIRRTSCPPTFAANEFKSRHRMTSVLVVDDSAMDRRLAGAFIEKDAQFEVAYAGHGAEALASMNRAAPALVVTDLIMPEMDGLELVAAVREKFPYVPVILMTSLGSEEIAVKALHQGAASYVPKKYLGRDLLDTARRVLAVSGHKLSHARLMGCLTETTKRFTLHSDRALIPALIGHLQESLGQLGLCDDVERMQVGVALEEALTNSLYHGNLEISSQLRENDFATYYATYEERVRIAPYRDRVIQVDARIARDEAEFTIRDEGPGFDPASLPDPTDPANLERLSGRGVLLMRTFMDEVIYNSMGNEVRMIKRRRDCDQAAHGDGKAIE